MNYKPFFIYVLNFKLFFIIKKAATIAAAFNSLLLEINIS